MVVVELVVVVLAVVMVLALVTVRGKVVIGMFGNLDGPFPYVLVFHMFLFFICSYCLY